MSWTDFIQQQLTSGMNTMDFAAGDLGPFPVDPVHTGMVIAYKNNRLIADLAMPYVQVEGEEFKWERYPKGTFFTVPDTQVGRKGVPNQVEHASTTETSSTEDHGLIDLVPHKDVEKYNKAGINAVSRAVEFLFALVMLARELRVAAAYATDANFGGKKTISGDDQWNVADKSHPIAEIQTALDQMLMRANTMVVSRKGYSALSRHPEILKAVHHNAGDAGIARKEDIAAIWELDDIHVGDAWVNVAAPGKPANLQRAWANHCALVHMDKTADTRRGFTWGLTARWGTRIAGQIPHPLTGLRGGVYVKTGESTKELVMAPDAGYLLKNVVAS